MRPGISFHFMVALACVLLGQAFIFLRWRPVTDFYFLLVWGGYILLVDYLVYRRAGRSLLRHATPRFLVMFPLSSLFWWVFEFYNEFVGNWVYLGSDLYVGLAYVLVSSLFFSTVVPAVWETAELLLTFFPAPGRAELRRIAGGAGATSGSLPPPASNLQSALPGWLLPLGVILSLLPLVFPSYAFPLVWVGLFVMLDPLNARAGRPSILAMLQRGRWQVPVAFALAATITGFFWEFWNYWAWPKWIYDLHPLVASFPHLFEMPLPGYLGYGPFGWELFAMWWFCIGLRDRILDFRF